MTTKPTDEFDTTRIIVEALTPFDAKSQELIIRWAREKLGLQPAQSPIAPPAGPAPLIPPRDSVGAGGRPPDIKAFVETKKPQSDNQFAAVVAYYYQFEAPENERKQAITKEDLQDATRKVGRDRINLPGQTLINAHGRGYFDKAERGTYKLTTVGENLVAMALPGGPGGGTLPKKKARKKKAKKKV
jgi:hypothetical protein